MNSLLSSFKEEFSARLTEDMSMDEYLTLCKNDSTAYATPAERMLAAIGDPLVIETSKHERLGRIFGNRTIRTYPAFADFYGMEDTVERICQFFRHAAQGLEERKQILYLLGPVGGGKSSLAERLKALMEKQPIYVLKYKGAVSPVFESPLGLFSDEKWHPVLEQNYGIPKRVLNFIPSPWAVKRLNEAKGDLSDFTVSKVFPSKLEQVALSKTEPGDDNNQDISVLVGKVDIRKLEDFSQSDTDAYGYSGGLNRANQGLLEFVEMFKAPIKMLHPLLTATQESNYVGTENIGAIPFQGVILAHSNEAEWESFRNDRKNEAFLDRVYLIKVPYCLRVTEEEQIYAKLIEGSKLAQAPCAPGTMEMLARFCVLSRLVKHENSNQWSKMHVYDGKSMKDKDPSARSVQEYRQHAGQDEGMNGYSTRAAFKVLSSVYNFDPDEISADQIHLMMILTEAVKREQFKNEADLLDIIEAILKPKFIEDIQKTINEAFLDSYEEYAQNVFDTYASKADAWIADQDFTDPDSGMRLNREMLDADLQKIERPAGISNAKDFRSEIVRFYLRQRVNLGKAPSWKSYDKFREVIELNVFQNAEEMLPVISFSGTHKDEDSSKKHTNFVERMRERGFTEKMTRRYVEYYTRYHRS